MTTKQTAKPAGVKTPEQVKQELAECGISVAEWARTHSINKGLVYRLLAGTHVGHRGQTHRAAVLLGLKAGRIDVQPADLAAVPVRKATTPQHA